MFDAIKIGPKSARKSKEKINKIKENLLKEAEKDEGHKVMKFKILKASVPKDLRDEFKDYIMD